MHDRRCKINNLNVLTWLHVYTNYLNVFCVTLIYPILSNFKEGLA